MAASPSSTAASWRRLRPFTVAIADDRLADLRRRLHATRWPDDPGKRDWTYGVEPGWLEEMTAEIAAAGGTAIASVTDVSDSNEARKLIESPIATWGKLDILVNCAGNFVRDTIVDATPENLDRVRRVHLDGMMQTSHFAAGHWVERREYGR